MIIIITVINTKLIIMMLIIFALIIVFISKNCVCQHMFSHAPQLSYNRPPSKVF